MRCLRYVTSLSLFALLAPWLSGQGLNTTASKDDWEEINFEFNSSVLVDGFPSLLRMADLLHAHSDYRLKVEGHADQIGSSRYNERLGLRRANTVRDFLVKYGAAANQINATSLGKRDLKVNSRDKNARFMNRRVSLTLTDGSGKVIGAGSINDTLRAAGEAAEATKCCNDILKRLDRLDEIADMLKRSIADNDALRKEIGDLRKSQADLDAFVRGMPKPLTQSETAQIVDTRTAEQIERARLPRYATINMNVGADSNSDVTFNGRGRLFFPFKEQFGVQLQGEYFYFRDRQEGQFDFGIVDRFHARAQAGLFSSFKYVSLSNRAQRTLFPDLRVQPYSPTMSAGQTSILTPGVDPNMPVGNGLLGQASATFDYLFSRGRLGVFGSKGFLTEATLNRTALGPNLFNEFYIRTVDQVGLSTTLGLMGNVYLEGNLGYLKSRAYADRPGGTARFVFPISDKFAFTVEGGMNETLLTRDNWGRVAAGIQLGNYQRPKDYMNETNGVLHAVPADIPRVRWELLTRRVRTGNGAPVADAGPDQIGVPAGSITLNGSGSFDPEGDPITYQWTQIAGPSVALSGANTATASFTAAEGQTYSFRLTVTDDHGAQGIARTSVSTTRPATIQIVRFQASPSTIQTGQSTTLDWQVLNADTVTITQLGDVDANGTRQVSPTQTTQYQLTATNRSGSVTATTTVVVQQATGASLTACQVQPTNILPGESATILWSTQNATGVSISPGFGSLATSGSQSVSPTATTTYTITATGATGTPAATCSVTVTVTEGTAPRVVQFAATPPSIQSGQSSALAWNVENADSVSISENIGTVALTGNRSVSPTATTTYTLTATNRFGSTQATTVVAVSTPVTNPSLSACTASPTTSTGSGTPVELSWTVTNATNVTVSGYSGNVPLNGPITVNPTQSTTYTITATGAQGTSPATCTVNVTVPGTQGGGSLTVLFSPGPMAFTSSRDVAVTAQMSPFAQIVSGTWTALSPGASVVSQSASSAVLRAGSEAGDYQFEYTGTTSDGRSASAIETLRYIPAATTSAQ